MKTASESGDFAASVQRVRALLVARGIKGAADADVHTLANMSAAAALPMTGEAAVSSGALPWATVMTRLGVRKTAKSGASSETGSGALPWSTVIAQVEKGATE